MKPLHLTIFVLFIALYSCQETGDVDFKIPIIIDTLKAERVERNTVYHQYAQYNILYIGKRTDSIYISKYASLDKYYVFQEYGKMYSHPDSTDIKLHVDTTKVIFNRASLFEGHGKKWKEKYYKAYPVFLRNSSKDTLIVGYGDLEIFMEALDSNKCWLPIEEIYWPWCGTGLTNYMLPANEIIVTSAPLNKGKMKTKLRLRYDNVLSNEFDGAINPSQFDSRRGKDRRLMYSPEE